MLSTLETVLWRAIFLPNQLSVGVTLMATISAPARFRRYYEDDSLAQKRDYRRLLLQRRPNQHDDAWSDLAQQLYKLQLHVIKQFWAKKMLNIEVIIKKKEK